MKKFIATISISFGILGLSTLPFNRNLSNSLISISIGNLLGSAILTRFYEFKIDKITQKSLNSINLESQKIELQIRLDESKKLIKILESRVGELEKSKNQTEIEIVKTLKTVSDREYQKLQNLIPFLVKKFELKNFTMNDLILKKSNLNTLETHLDLVFEIAKIQSKIYRSIVQKFEKTTVPVEKFENLKKDLTAIKTEFYGSYDQLVKIYETDFKELVIAGDNQSKKLQFLENEIKEKSLPFLFLGVSESSNVGNSIIAHFSKIGIRLDGYESKETETGYVLIFSLEKNNRYLNASKLNENDMSDKIKVLANSLNSPVFSDRENGKVELVVEKRLKINKTDYKEVDRLYTSCKHFGETIARLHAIKPTLRISASTGSGKGVFLKNYIDFLLKNSDFKIGLVDPVSGSDQDFWECEKMGNSIETALKKFDDFYDEFYARKNGKKDYKPVLLVLDEIDKSFDKEYKVKISRIWTEIRHYKMKMCLSGQSSEVGKNGWRWDELHNCIQIYIGSGILTACKHGKDIGLADSKTKKILESYNAITEHFNRLNEYLPEKNHHRIALAVLDGKYEFVEIPPAVLGRLDGLVTSF